jgi:hypothetical protein
MKAIFDINYLKEHGTIGKKVKMIVTGWCMIAMAILSYTLIGVKGIYLWPMSITGFTVLFNIIFGYFVHNDIFYMSETTWPDKQLLSIFKSGANYLAVMTIATLLFSLLILKVN